MSNVISFVNMTAERKRYQFVNKPVMLHEKYDKDISFPCIVLRDMQTGEVVGYPQFERWLFSLNKAEQQASVTLRKKASSLCVFLNFLLWNTSCNYIHDVDLTILRDFVSAFRRKDDGSERSLDGWNRGIADIYDFLLAYYYYNYEVLPFRFQPSDLVSTQAIINSETKRKAIIRQYNKLSVRPPRKKKRKNRQLLHGYLDTLLFECKKHDPMIALAVALGAYAGLREGETMNLLVGSIEPIYAGFGIIGNVSIDLTKDAPFVTDWKGKSSFGDIKVHRMQNVYPDFIRNIMNLYQEHLRLLEHKGFSTDSDAPLFVNEWGKPLSSASYRQRLKDVFKQYFLPDLRAVVETEGQWGENAAFIEAYEESYPGAHMLRHWYTMYLVTKTNLTTDEISMWRGDRSRESMLDYVHVNADMLAAYRDSMYTFHQSLLEEIL